MEIRKLLKQKMNTEYVDLGAINIAMQNSFQDTYFSKIKAALQWKRVMLKSKATCIFWCVWPTEMLRSLTHVWLHTEYIRKTLLVTFWPPILQNFERSGSISIWKTGLIYSREIGFNIIGTKTYVEVYAKCSILLKRQVTLHHS